MENIKKLYKETPFQTAGPFLHIGCMPNFIGIEGIYNSDIGSNPFPDKQSEDLIKITGSIFDGKGEALDDVLLETWQSDENGKYSGVCGFARFVPDKITKKFSLFTVKPGPVKNFDGKLQSPHIVLSISSRGLNMSLNTRIYFDDDNLKNDPLISFIRENHNDGSSLIAEKIDKKNYLFNVFLQGDKETIFLDL
ncbi:protocatechuate 3,4-dioxygenase subunit alpha [Alphaproteobacteria bacterium]|nr:protocatechuate 3,4-dioxygenase subunit alpha [Alphaproteobacteria bacterium]